ncbi:flavin monoamine oxidase family protein [Luteimonas kalidii]|uniref:NAD(P)/FAD-dependent oxidoreductase n=1 Tax=Luteimonas kalidii TaxID=3042025 RepID=A0ABT6JRR6_9GAMM|nr:NAD(P)/FAD-dependent oxidoreductase [Luteimonas kalidii]MDH5833374.1 NAD(P)/FAD-dependent oxidoreductase [Luteimonas kalidii]
MVRSNWMAQVLRLVRRERTGHHGDDDATTLRAGTPRDGGRRRVLQAGLAGATAAGAGTLATPLLAAGPRDAREFYARLTNTRGVAVVGAGLAGLACATELARQGVPARVFEAAQRVGGRCWSARGLFPGQVAERGAEFIGASHHAMLGYARALDLALEPVDGDAGHAFHHFAGQRHGEGEIAAELRAFADFIQEDLTTLGTPDARRFDPRAEALDFMTLAEYLDLYGASGLLRSVLGNAVQGEFGSELDEVSALGFLRFVHHDRRGKFGYGPRSGGSLRVAGGNDLIATGLAGRLPQPVEHGHRLVALDRRFGGALRLTFEVGGHYVQRDYDAVVLALPFTVLREVEFGGGIALPPDKRRAIANAEMGDAGRLLVGFRSPYWRAQGASGSGSTDLPHLQHTWETNPTHSGRSGAVLSQQLGGQAARALRPASVQLDAATFVASLDRVLPGAAAAASRDRRGRLLAISENWSVNPLSRGAVPRPQPGYFTTLAHTEATAVENVMFAGDHTSSFYEWQGFMEGAVLSGLRAANEACDHMWGR